MTFAIVAIPREDDPIWKISSEKVPHLTILSLGDKLDNVSRVADYLGHVAETSLHRFGLSVDHRGVLGLDEADVLFFEKGGTKCLMDARADLLKNKDVFTAYNTSSQFPIWTPHLTLGYPTSPAKPNNLGYPISWVSFDRVALWIDDFEGPEFQLNEAELSDAAWSSLTENGLMHFGVKGMHWGQRKAAATANAAAARSAGVTKGQQKYNRNQHGKRGANRINARVAGGMELKKARDAELDRNAKQAKTVAVAALAAYGAVRIAPVVGKYTMIALRSAAAKKIAAQGAAAARASMMSGKGIPSYKTVNLIFDGAAGVWS